MEVREILDTVYLVAYLRPSDPLHQEAEELLSKLGNGRAVSQAALLDLDLIMKSRGFTARERTRVWALLECVLPSGVIETLVPSDFAVAVELCETMGLDYFDALVAAQCVVRGARPLTTDGEIIEAVKLRKLSGELS